MYKIPPKKALETIADEITRLPVRPGDVYKYKDTTLYAVTEVTCGAGSLRGSYFVSYRKVEERRPCNFEFSGYDIRFIKELDEFCESMVMYSGQNSLYEL